VYAVSDRGLGAGRYGLALSASGLGALIGTLAAIRLSGRFGYGRTFAGALALSTGLPLLIAVVPGTGTTFAVWLSLIQLIAGIGLGIANVLSVTLRQIVAPPEALARTGAGYRLLIYGVIPIGSAVGGVLGEISGSGVAVLVGALALALSILPMLSRRVLRLRAPEDARPAPTGPTAVPADARPA
jgi:MFS family permease